jgi:hypothetical protein
MRVLTIALPLLAVAGCASLENSPARMQLQAREATRLNEALAGFSPGKPVSCLPNRDIRGPEAYGETTLLFRVNRRAMPLSPSNSPASYVPEILPIAPIYGQAFSPAPARWESLFPIHANSRTTGPMRCG